MRLGEGWLESCSDIWSLGTEPPQFDFATFKAGKPDASSHPKRSPQTYAPIIYIGRMFLTVKLSPVMVNAIRGEAVARPLPSSHRMPAHLYKSPTPNVRLQDGVTSSLQFCDLLLADLSKRAIPDMIHDILPIFHRELFPH